METGKSISCPSSLTLPCHIMKQTVSTTLLETLLDDILIFMSGISFWFILCLILFTYFFCVKTAENTQHLQIHAHVQYTLLSKS